jgi:hypothetical protein
MEYCGLALARVNWPYDPFAPDLSTSFMASAWTLPDARDRGEKQVPHAQCFDHRPPRLGMAHSSRHGASRTRKPRRGFPCPSCRAQERTIGRCASCRPGAAVAQDHPLPRSTSPRERRVRSFRLAALRQGGRLGFHLEWGEPLARKFSEPQAPSRPRRRWSSTSCRLSWGTSGKKDHGCKRLPKHVDIDTISVSYLDDSSLI